MRRLQPQPLTGHRAYPLVASVASYWTLDEQLNALGPTRLDRVLAGEAAPLQGEGAFARQYAAALQQAGCS